MNGGLERGTFREEDPETSSLRAAHDDDTESTANINDEAFFDLIAGAQRSRMDDQRAALPVFPGLHMTSQQPTGADESFFDMILRSQEDTRIQSQRTTMPVQTQSRMSAPNALVTGDASSELFFDMLQRLQASRMDEQRTMPPTGLTSTETREEFFDLIQRVQSARLDEQRSQPPQLEPQTSQNVIPEPSSKPSSNRNSFLSRIGSGKRKC
ncbi:G-protein-signaling modulator 1 [Cichlidogyrus casuarinus]|uniref:G-protein-signaling modulator 1 n=1 Tax=Cichlidogyrus casuarinus TaxID=1844966 RepID=A0ABD2PVI2_9PLAT